MDLYIIRHAWAAESDDSRWPDDGMRPLTAEGKERFARVAKKLVGALRQEIGIPIHFHTHDTSGVNAASILKAADAGVDIADAAIASMSGQTSQPNLNSIVAALEQLGAGDVVDAGVDAGGVQQRQRFLHEGVGDGALLQDHRHVAGALGPAQQVDAGAGGPARGPRRGAPMRHGLGESGVVLRQEWMPLAREHHVEVAVELHADRLAGL